MARPRNRPFSDSGPPKGDGAELVGFGKTLVLGGQCKMDRALAIPAVVLMELAEWERVIVVVIQVLSRRMAVGDVRYRHLELTEGATTAQPVKPQYLHASRQQHVQSLVRSWCLNKRVSVMKGPQACVSGCDFFLV